MRTRSFRPAFDRLDMRLLLDGSGVPANPQMPGDEVDPVAVVNYYGPGNPPGDTEDPTDPSSNMDSYITPTTSD